MIVIGEMNGLARMSPFILSGNNRLLEYELNRVDIYLAVCECA